MIQVGDKAVIPPKRRPMIVIQILGSGIQAWAVCRLDNENVKKAHALIYRVNELEVIR